MNKQYERIVKGIDERGTVKVPNGCVTGEEFENWLRERDIHLTREEIVEDCKGIIEMLDEQNQYSI